MGLINGGIRAAKDGGVQKTNDVCVRGQFWAMPKTEVESVSKSKAYFETLSYKLGVQQCTRKYIAEPSILGRNLFPPRIAVYKSHAEFLKRHP